MSKPLNFQSIILKLQQYWADQGCLIWQPYYSQVGAGTMNPATVLRVLGPEPWNVVYVEPSVRPDDGRYGENPNRFQMHYQLQVILKPDPGNPQELYLRSLEAIGIDPRQHDIRFVEDNWESPALGAWGLGWEVWLDGQEITQFTYFQQSGGFVLDPVSVEITYGLERIAMPLQRVHNFKDMRWSDFITDGDLNFQAEYEHSKYYFEFASVERLRQMYDLFEAEANAAIAAGLALPAHDYVLKCSHTFNVLDTRGAVGVTERQALFARMRDLSHRVAQIYMDQRQNLEYPLLDDVKIDGSSPLGQAARRVSSPTPGLTTASAAAEPAAAQDFLLEIGTEELPSADLESALDQLRQRLPGWLDELRLPHGELRILGTPRRLVVFAGGMASRQEDRISLVKGPPADRAFDAMGLPTKAAEGFARSRGINVSDLRVEEMDGGRYTVADIHEPGRPAVQVLSEALPAWAASLRFDKSMRWNASGVSFSRPVRWLLALYGSEVVPFQFAGLESGRTTRGLRHVEPAEFPAGTPDEYFRLLQAQGILVNPALRRETVAGQVTHLLEEAGATPSLDEDLLDEVANLVEAPTAFRGTLEQKSMSLPSEVLISVMKKHQRYFPVQKDGWLLPEFIAVRNGGREHLDVVTDGNEQVIRARFADAAFFIAEDLRQPLEAYLPRLGTLMFQKKLGSMLDKTHRIERMVDLLIPSAGLTSQEEAALRRAAQLCKADLVTHMVVEMTSLQGVMGAAYALKSGESQETALAIREHYLPRSVKDAAPTSRPGLLLGIVDRLDTLSGLFAAGLAPTGTRDPFAQRRAALGLSQALISWGMDFDLRSGLDLAADSQPIEASPESRTGCLEFIAGRLRGLLLDQGWRYDVVDAVLAVQSANPAGASRAVQELSAWTARPDWAQILPAYARCVRITRALDEVYPLDASLLVLPAEQELLALLQQAEDSPRRPASPQDFLAAFQPLIPAVNRFFDDVLVMDENPDLRRARLALLQRISALARDAADLSVLEGF